MSDPLTNTTAATAVRTYFAAFLPGLRNQLLIADLATLNAVCAIAVSDMPDPPWRLTIADGRLTQVGQGGLTPEATFRLSAETLLEVVSGRLSPQEAFFSQMIELEGDLETGLKLSTVLAPFFERFPFEA